MAKIDLTVLESHLAALTFMAIGATVEEADWLYQVSTTLPTPHTPTEVMYNNALLYDLLQRERRSKAAEKSEDY